MPPISSTPPAEAGRPLPFLVDSTVTKSYSGGKLSWQLVLRYAIKNAYRDAFVAALPNVIGADSFATFLTAAEIEKWGLGASYYTGMELSNVSDSRDGYHTLLSITYSTPNTDAGTLAWWTSEPAGLVYHERKRVPVSGSKAAAENALEVKFGLSPNGSSFNASTGDTYGTLEASWGPNADESPDPEHPQDLEKIEPDAVAFSTSLIQIPLSNDAIAWGLGMWGADMHSHGADFYYAQYVVGLENGTIKKIENGFTGQNGWFYDTGSAYNLQPVEFPDAEIVRDMTMERVAEYAKMCNSRSTVEWRQETLSIRRHAKVMTLAELRAQNATIGTESASISYGSETIPAPPPNLPEPYKNFPARVFWRYCGRQLDSYNLRTVYKPGASNVMQKIEYCEVGYTDTWQSVIQLSVLRIENEPTQNGD